MTVICKYVITTIIINQKKITKMGPSEKKEPKKKKEYVIAWLNGSCDEYIIHICNSRPNLITQLKNIYGNKERDCTSHGSPGARMMSRRFRDCCTPNSWVKGGQLIYIYRTDNIYLYTYIRALWQQAASPGKRCDSSTSVHENIKPAESVTLDGLKSDLIPLN